MHDRVDVTNLVKAWSTGDHARYFGGLTEEEIASVLDISPRTVRRDWEFARVWLAREMDPSSERRA